MMNEEKYSLEDVKKKFKYLCDRLTRGESNFLFVTLSHYLPKNIIDSLGNDVEFICLSAKKNDGEPTCGRYHYVDPPRSHIIVYSHLVFFKFNDFDEHLNRVGDILHEIAHFHLGHTSVDQDRDRKEEEAKQKVYEWIFEESSDYTAEERSLVYGNSNDVE